MEKAIQRLTETLRFGVFVCRENGRVHTHPYTLGEYEDTKRLLESQEGVTILYSTHKRPLSKDQLVQLMEFGQLSQDERDRTAESFIEILQLEVTA